MNIYLVFMVCINALRRFSSLWVHLNCMTNRIGIDEWLRVPTAQDVFSIGDCSGFLECTGKPVLPALAQVLS